MTSNDTVSGARPNCCLECRSRHVKCYTITGETDCSNCLSHDYLCVRETIQFRHGENPSIVPSRGTGKRQYEYSQNQIWLKPASKFVYIDETQELRTIYSHDDEPIPSKDDAAARHGPGTLSSKSGGMRSPLHTAGRSERRPELFSPRTHSRTGSREASDTMSMPPQLGQRSLDWAISPPNGRTFTTQADFIMGFDSTSRWSLQNAQEAYLMQHYVQVIGAYMDVLDPDRHFTLVLPYRAANCPTLQQAIFALSARHLSRIGDFDPYISDKYSRKVIDEIFPLISGTDVTMDVDLLCATVVLRLLEELDVAYTGHDHERHLKGVQILMNAQMESAMATGGLQQAAICIALHQEITGALMSHRPIAPFLKLENTFDRSFAPADDRTWAFRIILHNMNILSFCYTKDSSNSPHPHSSHISTQDPTERQRVWRELMEYAKQWDALQPTHFKPMYEEAASADSPFPLIYFHRPIHIMAAMHLHACLILLVSHNPSFHNDYPITGVGGISHLRRAAQTLREVDERMRFHVRAICGIAMCNDHLASAMIMSTAIVKLCAEHFVGEERDQKAIMRMLELNETKHGWPTKLVQGHLKDIWHWKAT